MIMIFLPPVKGENKTDTHLTKGPCIHSRAGLRYFFLLHILRGVKKMGHPISLVASWLLTYLVTQL